MANTSPCRRASLQRSASFQPDSSSSNDISPVNIRPHSPKSRDAAVRSLENTDHNVLTAFSSRPNSSDAPQDNAPQGQAEPPRSASPEHEIKKGAWHGIWGKYGSIELENKGSVARDHLALERTFLAWLRTSLSFASIGIAITQLFRLNTNLSSPQRPFHTVQTALEPMFKLDSPQSRMRHLGKPLGATFIAISVVMLFLGFHRYFEAQHYIIRGKFPASRGSVVVVSAISGALIVSSLVIILVTAPAVWGK